MLVNLPQHEDLLTEAIPKNLDMATEYRALFVLDHLSPQQANRAEEILILARQDKQLDSLITNIIYQEGNAKNLADDTCTQSYKNQIAALREYQCTKFSGLANTMFGNAETVVSTSSACTEEILSQDIHNLAIALQENADFI